MNQAGDYTKNTLQITLQQVDFEIWLELQSEPGMWTSILMTNAEPIIERIEDFKDRLTYISQL